MPLTSPPPLNQDESGRGEVGGRHLGPRRTNQGGKKTIALRGRRGLFLPSDFPPSRNFSSSSSSNLPPAANPPYVSLRTLSAEEKKPPLPLLTHSNPPSPFSLFRGPSSSSSSSFRLPIHSPPFVPPSSSSPPPFFSFRRKSQPSSTCVKKEKEEDEILFLPLL